MHFHDQLGCIACKKNWYTSTPIASDIILLDHCQWCGQEAMVGMINTRVCRDCLEEFLNGAFKRKHLA